MILNEVKKKLSRGSPVIGTFVGLQSPNVAELMGHAGFEYVVIESEHNALDSADIEHMMMAIGNTGAVPVVRIPSSDKVYIQRALDTGAQGIVVPSVTNAEEAGSIVAATKFPPNGTRSWGPLRASKYTFDNVEYFHESDENILVILIIETRGALDNLEEIASVPGVDVLFLGPWDMCLSLGLNPLDQPHKEIDSVMKNIIKVSDKNTTVAGGGASTPDDIASMIDSGAKFISYGPDYSLLSRAAKEGIDAFNGITEG